MEGVLQAGKIYEGKSVQAAVVMRSARGRDSRGGQPLPADRVPLNDSNPFQVGTENILETCSGMWCKSEASG